jgi:hypothetical protein
MGAAHSLPSAEMPHGITVLSEHRVASVIIHPERAEEAAASRAGTGDIRPADQPGEDCDAHEWRGGEAYFAAAGVGQQQVPMIVVQKGVFNVIVTPLNGACARCFPSPQPLPLPLRPNLPPNIAFALLCPLPLLSAQ